MGESEHVFGGNKVWVFVRASVEADNVLACVCAYLVPHAVVGEEVELVEVGEKGEKVNVEKVNLTLVMKVGE